MATPLVAGTAALLHSQAFNVGDKITPQQIKAVLQATGHDINVETGCNCIIDAAAALNHLQDQELTIVPNAGSFAKLATPQFKGFGGVGPFTFESSNKTVATIDAEGVMSALTEGQTVLTVKDAKGNAADSHTIFVGRKAPDEGGGGGACPYPAPLCDIMCQVDPNLPWCG
jgi:hypothetical protein